MGLVSYNQRIQPRVCAPFLLPHLRDGIRDIKCTDLLLILKLKELVAAVTRHEDEYVGPIVRQ